MSCQKLAQKKGQGNTEFGIDLEVCLVGSYEVDGAVKREFPENLASQVLGSSHYPVLSGQPGARRIYDAMRKSYYWTKMTNDVHKTVRD